MERNQDPHVKELAVYDSIRPALRWDGSVPFAEWKKQVQAKLMELLGLPLEKCDPLFQIEYEKQHEGYREIRFTFQSEEGYFVPGHFLIPEGEGKRPTALCLQGHTLGMHTSLGEIRCEEDRRFIEDEDMDFAIQAVKNGFCALCIEQRAFGECGGKDMYPDCHVPTMLALLTGRTMVGLRAWDAMRAIDLLETQFSEYVDPDRVICVGISGGGTTTLYTAALDERICLSVPAGYVCTIRDSIAAMEHCVCNFIPNLAKWLDFGDIAGSMAPRPVILVAGDKDPIFPLPGVEKAFQIMQKDFADAGAPDNCRMIVGEGEHRFFAVPAWDTIRELMKL